MADTDYTTIGYVASSAGSIKTCGSGEINRVACIEFHNTNTTTEVVQVHFVKHSGGALGTASSANRKAYYSIAANETVYYEPKFPDVMTEENDSIQAVTTTASKVTATVKGVVST